MAVNDISHILPQPLPHLEARALQHQVSSLDKIQRQFQVEIRSLTQRLQVTNELGQSCVVEAAVAQRDVTLDLGAAVDALRQVTLIKSQSKELFTCTVGQWTDVQSEGCV